MTSSSSVSHNQSIFDLNSKQKEAYEYDGHCVVLAGPGSGKTKVLVAKVARLLNQRTSGPRGVACITYNNECARELRSRLGQLGIERDRRLFVGTIHSFCLACVVAPFGRLFREDLSSQLKVASPEQRTQALQNAVDKLNLGDIAANWQSQFDRYRRTHPLRDSKRWIEDPEMVQLITTYEDLLHSAGLLDFDDLILIALNLIRQEEFVRSALEARFPFLVIDEYQDLGFPLHLIVRYLMRNTGIEVFAVGDPDQSIYGFMGANPRYLRELGEDPKVHVVELDLNYRCGQRIIDGSQVALAPEEPREYKSTRDDTVGELIFLEWPEGFAKQADVIAEDIIPDLNAQGIVNGQIAILAIDRRDIEVLSTRLSDSGIKFAGAQDRRYPRTPFTRWLEDIAVWSTKYPNNQDGPTLDDLLHFWAELHLQAGISLDSSRLEERARFFDAISNLASPEMNLSDWFEGLERNLGINNKLSRRTTYPEDALQWSSLRTSCEAGETLERYQVEDFARCGGKLDTVTLTTLHSSKGLEYQVVILPGLEEGRLPSYYAAKSDEAISEVRRLLYVGITRAKDSVYLLYSGWYYSFGGRTFSNGPSRFVIELQEQTQIGT